MKNAIKNYFFDPSYNSLELIVFGTIMGSSVRASSPLIEFAVKAVLVLGSFALIRFVGYRVMGETK